MRDQDGKNPEQQTSEFAALMEDVKPLRQDRVEPYRKKRKPLPIQQPKELLEEPENTVELAESEVATHDYLEFVRPGVQHRVFQELKRGQIEAGMELDLHGLTTTFAKEVLDDCLAHCLRTGVRCLHIIHGKGYGSENRQPVLKQKANYWLRLHPEVLAFCSATRRDGGTGALYVLLKGRVRRRR
jgi:DNA-nicking Smr family endonuclease